MDCAVGAKDGTVSYYRNDGSRKIAKYTKVSSRCPHHLIPVPSLRHPCLQMAGHAPFLPCTNTNPNPALQLTGAANPFVNITSSVRAGDAEKDISLTFADLDGDGT